MQYKFTQSDSRNGGLSTVKKHGIKHMQQIGAIGFQTTVDRHWKGDREAYKEHLRDKCLLKTADMESIAMLDLYRQYRPDLF